MLVDPAEVSEDYVHEAQAFRIEEEEEGGGWIARLMLIQKKPIGPIMRPKTMQWDRRIRDLRTLFVHAHNLVNLFRPYQARAAIRMLLERENERKKTEAADLDR
jgi:hypothetical protein